MTLYLRTQEEPNRQIRKFDHPLDAKHPLVDLPCPACHYPFDEGDVVTLVVLGPGDDKEEQMKCRSGRPYNAVAVAVHTACATGELPNPGR